ncbi:MAG: hypothetical protein AAF721_30175 [Myxococcota bacterium]
MPAARAEEENRQGGFEFGRGDVVAAHAWFTSALDRSRAIDDPRGQTIALLNLSRVDGVRWWYERAERRAEEALALAGDSPQLRGAALARIAEIRSQRGAHPQAIADARAANALVGGVKLRRKQARRLRGDRATTLAYTLARAGGPHCSEAEAVLSDIPGMYGRAADAAAEAAVAGLRARLAMGRGRATEATTHLRVALSLDRQRGRPLDVAADLEALAAAAEAAGDDAAALSWLDRALSVRESIDTPQQAIATAAAIARLGGGGTDLPRRVSLLRSEAGDAPVQMPAPANACD